MFSSIFEFIKAIPVLVSIVKQLIGLLNEWQEKRERKQRAEELREAIVCAREKKDTSKLDKFFSAANPLPVGDGNKPMPETTRVDS